jgi:hypothetical protein
MSGQQRSAEEATRRKLNPLKMPLSDTTNRMQTSKSPSVGRMQQVWAVKLQVDPFLDLARNTFNRLTGGWVNWDALSSAQKLQSAWGRLQMTPPPQSTTITHHHPRARRGHPKPGREAPRGRPRAGRPQGQVHQRQGLVLFAPSNKARRDRKGAPRRRRRRDGPCAAAKVSDGSCHVCFASVILGNAHPSLLQTHSPPAHTCTRMHTLEFHRGFLVLEQRGRGQVLATTHELNALNARLRDAAADAIMLTLQVGRAVAPALLDLAVAFVWDQDVALAVVWFTCSCGLTCNCQDDSMRFPSHPNSTPPAHSIQSTDRPGAGRPGHQGARAHAAAAAGHRQRRAAGRAGVLLPGGFRCMVGF